jgi:outer membrane protein TolC/ABC-type uncharacterized transport system substrate-binding protein
MSDDVKIKKVIIMNKYWIHILSILFIVLITGTACPQGTKKTINVGYFEGGAYFLHKAIMGELREYLDKLSGEEFEIAFDPFGYKSAEWNRNICRAMAGDLVRKKNLDIIIAAGPWVVEDLIEAGFDKPIIAIHQSYPELSGLVDSAGRPAYPNLTITYDPAKLESDFSALSKLFPKSKCGFLYFPSNDEFERVSQKARQAGLKYGLEIIPAEEYSESGVYSFFISRDKIQREIDVLYLPPLLGLDLDMLREFFTQVHFNKIPTFVSEGFLLLEKGAIATNCDRPYRSEARIAAYKIDRIIHGAIAAGLPTRYPEFQMPGINPTEANNIGLKFGRNSISKAKMVPEIPDEAIERYTLIDAFEQARRENADFRARTLGYERAMVEAKKAYSAYLPNLAAQIGAVMADNEIEVARYNDILNRKFFAEINLEQKLFSYSTIKAIQAAQKGREIEQLNFKAAENDLEQVISAAFISIIENEDKAAGLTDIVDRLREYLEMALTDYQLGIIGAGNISLIEERLLNARIELINATNELQVSRVILNCLWNRPSDDKFVLRRDGFDNPSMVRLMQEIDFYSGTAGRQECLVQFLVNYGIDNSAAMEMANLSIGRHRDLMAENRGKYYPEISLQAKYSHGKEFNPVLDERQDFWLIGGLINIPIFPGEINNQDKKILRFQSDELLYKKDAMRLKLMGDITSIAEVLFARMTTLPINYESRTLSRQNLDTEAQKYGIEKLQYDNLLRLEQNLAEREIKLIEDKYGFFKAYLELLFAVGSGYLRPGSDEEKVFFEQLTNCLKN